MHIGFFAVDITPNTGVELCGYGYYLARKAERVLDPLFARAVAFRSYGKTLLIIDCDLIGLGSETVEAVRAILRRDYGLKDEEVLLVSTHTHSGPATAILAACGEVDHTYVRGLPGKLVSAARGALENPVRVSSASFFASSFEGIGFNRVIPEGGPVDSEIRGLAFDLEDSPPLVLINYACHPVVLGVNREISADYPGQVVAAMEKRGYQAAFLNGFSGDIDPAINREKWGSGTFQTIRDYGELIASATLRGIENAVPLEGLTLGATFVPVELPLQWPDPARLQKEMDEAQAIKERNPGFARLIREWNSKLLEDIARGDLPRSETATVQLLRIGEVILIGFPGETFTQLGIMIREAYPGRKILTLGTANAVMRYIPTRDDIEREGYAGYASCRIYGRLPLSPGAGEKLAEATIEAIAEFIRGD